MADPAPDLGPTIESAAGQPSSASVDGQSASNRSLSELIAADKYLKGQAGAEKKARGLRFTRISPPPSA